MQRWTVSGQFFTVPFVLTLAILFACPVTLHADDPYKIAAQSFRTQVEAVNFLMSIPEPERQTARLIPVLSPRRFNYHVVWLGDDPQWRFGGLVARVASRDFGRNVCRAEWEKNHSCWYEETEKGESIVLVFAGWGDPPKDPEKPKIH